MQVVQFDWQLKSLLKEREQPIGRGSAEIMFPIWKLFPARKCIDDQRRTISRYRLDWTYSGREYWSSPWSCFFGKPECVCVELKIKHESSSGELGSVIAVGGKLGNDWRLCYGRNADEFRSEEDDATTFTSLFRRKQSADMDSSYKLVRLLWNYGEARVDNYWNDRLLMAGRSQDQVVVQHERRIWFGWAQVSRRAMGQFRMSSENTEIFTKNDIGFYSWITRDHD